MSNPSVPVENFNVLKSSDSAPHAESLSQHIQAGREAERLKNASHNTDNSAIHSDADKHLPHVSLVQREEIKEFEKIEDKNQLIGMPKFSPKEELEKSADKTHPGGELLRKVTRAVLQGGMVEY